MYQIVKETEKAVCIKKIEVEEKFNHVKEDFVEVENVELCWIPKSLCKVENGMVEDIVYWFASKNGLVDKIIEIDGKKFVRCLLANASKKLKELGLTKEQVLAM